MKIKRRDLNRIIESYLKEHMLLTTRLSGPGVISEYSLDSFTKDMTDIYGSIEDYASEVSDDIAGVIDDSVAFIEDQYDLIVGYWSDVTFDQFVKDASSIPLETLQSYFKMTEDLGFIDSFVIEGAIALGAGIVITAAGAPAAAGTAVMGVVAGVLGLGPMIVPTILELIEGRTLDDKIMGELTSLLQMALDENLISIQDLVEVSGEENYRVVNESKMFNFDKFLIKEQEGTPGHNDFIGIDKEGSGSVMNGDGTGSWHLFDEVVTLTHNGQTYEFTESGLFSQFGIFLPIAAALLFMLVVFLARLPGKPETKKDLAVKGWKNAGAFKNKIKQWASGFKKSKTTEKSTIKKSIDDIDDVGLSDIDTKVDAQGVPSSEFGIGDSDGLNPKPRPKDTSNMSNSLDPISVDRLINNDRFLSNTLTKLNKYNNYSTSSDLTDVRTAMATLRGRLQKLEIDYKSTDDDVMKSAIIEMNNRAKETLVFLENLYQIKVPSARPN